MDEARNHMTTSYRTFPETVLRDVVDAAVGEKIAMTARAALCLALFVVLVAACTSPMHFYAKGTGGEGGTGGDPTFCAPGETRECYTGPEGTKGQGICKAGEEACSRALAQLTRMSEAKKRAETFRRAFPKSVFRGAVDAATGESSQ